MNLRTFGLVKVERMLARMSNVWRTLITKKKKKRKNELVYILLLKFFEPRFFSMEMEDPESCNYSPAFLSCILWTLFFRLIFKLCFMEDRLLESVIKKDIL